VVKKVSRSILKDPALKNRYEDSNSLRGIRGYSLLLLKRRELTKILPSKEERVKKPSSHM